MIHHQALTNPSSHQPQPISRKEVIPDNQHWGTTDFSSTHSAMQSTRGELDVCLLFTGKAGWSCLGKPETKEKCIQTSHLDAIATPIASYLNNSIFALALPPKKPNNNRQKQAVFIPSYPTGSKDQGFGAMTSLCEWRSHSCSLKTCWAWPPADTADFHLSSSSSCGCQSHQLHGKPWCYQSA